MPVTHWKTYIDSEKGFPLHPLYVVLLCRLETVVSKVALHEALNFVAYEKCFLFTSSWFGILAGFLHLM
jgi:hypothetical protein